MRINFFLFTTLLYCIHFSYSGMYVARVVFMNEVVARAKFVIE